MIRNFGREDYKDNPIEYVSEENRLYGRQDGLILSILNKISLFKETIKKIEELKTNIEV